MLIRSEQNYPHRINLNRGFFTIITNIYARISMKGIRFANVKDVWKW